MLAATPPPPYTAVIFTARHAEDDDGYARTAVEMATLAAEQEGYLGLESVQDATTGWGITVSYWADDAAARAWKGVAEHLVAQRLGRQRWYERYEVRVATVERAYRWPAAEPA